MGRAWILELGSGKSGLGVSASLLWSCLQPSSTNVSEDDAPGEERDGGLCLIRRK